MSTVSRKDITCAARELGIQPGDTIIVHSSFKSMGHVDGGAESVVSGFLDAIGKEGTLVFPTLVQKDFTHAYETWYPDKPSDVGYLTNYFRKREGSVRSDQATHSVAACGKYASYLTQSHGHTHKRIGCFGNSAFSADSPWERMYDLNAKVVLLGVSPETSTFCHFAEYRYVNELLETVTEHPGYKALVGRLSRIHEGYSNVWPFVCNTWAQNQLEIQGAVRFADLGDAQLVSYHAQDFTDIITNALHNENWKVLDRTDKPDQIEKWKIWLSDCKIMQQTLKANQEVK